MQALIKTRRVMVVLFAVGVLSLVAAVPASAGPRLTCNATGHVTVSAATPSGWNWGVDGSGICIDNLQGPYTVQFAGAGTSDTLGFCDGLLVQNLAVNVTLAFTKVRGGAVTITNEIWTAPVTTFPIATPFGIGGSQSGLGTIATRVGFSCPPAGSSTAVFVWNQSTT